MRPTDARVAVRTPRLLALILLAACSAARARSPIRRVRRRIPRRVPRSARARLPGRQSVERRHLALPVDPGSATLIASCGLRNLHPDFGIECTASRTDSYAGSVHAAASRSPSTTPTRAIPAPTRFPPTRRSRAARRARRPPRARRRPRRVEAVRAVRRASAERRRELARRLGRGVRPRAPTRCGPKAGRRPTPPGCRSSPASCATTRR